MRTAVWASLGLSAACAGVSWGSTVTAANLGGPTNGGGAIGSMATGPLPILWGQSFTATVGGTLETISVDMNAVWALAPDLHVSVFALDGPDGVPTGAALGSAVFSAGTVVVGLNTIDFTSAGVHLAANTQYAFVMGIDPSDHVDGFIPYTVALDQTTQYAGGDALVAANGSTFQQNTITDLIFEVTVQAVPAPLAVVSGVLGLGMVAGGRRR